MAVPDVPNLPPQYAQVMIAQASQAQQVAANMNRSIGICRMAESVPRPADLGGGQNGLSPVAAARGYFRGIEHQVVAGASKVTVLKNPLHGTLEDLGTLAYDQDGKVTGDTGERSYYYHAEAGYIGQDSTTLLVEIGGYKVKVTYFFHVFAEVIYDDIPLKNEYCPNGYYWRISSTINSNGTSPLSSVEYSSPTESMGYVSIDILIALKPEEIDGVRLGQAHQAAMDFSASFFPIARTPALVRQCNHSQLF